eukprot:84744-Pelagomonas_calceolata.AAC.1
MHKIDTAPLHPQEPSNTPCRPLPTLPSLALGPTILTLQKDATHKLLLPPASHLASKDDLSRKQAPTPYPIQPAKEHLVSQLHSSSTLTCPPTRQSSRQCDHSPNKLTSHTCHHSYHFL